MRKDIKHNVLSQLRETSISHAIINELTHTDLLVYFLYGLTYDEIRFIKSQ